MNKKNLSVVMAGAMLATSVAPVLADTTTENTYEVTKGNAGLLIDKLDTLFATCDKFDEDAEKTSLAGQPVYTYQYKKSTDKTWSLVTPSNGTVDTNIIKTQMLNSNADITYDIQVVDLGHRTNEAGKIVSTKPGTPDWENSNNKYNESTFSTAAQNFESNTFDSGVLSQAPFKGIGDLKTGGVITSFVYDGSNSTAKINISFASGAKVTIVDKGDVLDLSAPIDSKGNILLGTLGKDYKAEDVYGFEYKAVTEASGADIEASVLYNVKLVPGDTVNVYNTNDLYDGLMLTEKGHSVMEEVKLADSVKIEGASASSLASESAVSSKIVTSIDSEGNNYSLKIELTTDNDTKVITIKGDNKSKLATLGFWIAQGHANVEILAGSNRYATAVEIAKTYVNAGGYVPVEAGGTGATLTEIVMVNGEALVDGLAAAPYAKSKDAPILLTADNKLPKETKEYLRELVDNYKVGQLPTITIIGGEAVVSQNVVDELKDFGFTVKRISGDNREETSLAVADKITKDKSDDVFVVGANGEADAMSIAPTATKNAAGKVTPIIVSKSSKGLSTVALNEIAYLVGSTGTATIIGGDAAVSADDESKLKELVNDEKTQVKRIAGSNRQETNALVIKEFHKNYTDVLVAKDGTTNKSELVDALPVSIFASVGDGATRPIVLATNNLSDAQLNQVVLNADKTNAETVYQVGYGVNTEVVKKIAERLGLTR